MPVNPANKKQWTDTVGQSQQRCESSDAVAGIPGTQRRLLCFQGYTRKKKKHWLIFNLSENLTTFPVGLFFVHNASLLPTCMIMVSAGEQAALSFVLDVYFAASQLHEWYDEPVEEGMSSMATHGLSKGGDLYILHVDRELNRVCLAAPFVPTPAHKHSHSLFCLQCSEVEPCNNGALLWKVGESMWGNFLFFSLELSHENFALSIQHGLHKTARLIKVWLLIIKLLPGHWLTPQKTRPCSSKLHIWKFLLPGKFSSCLSLALGLSHCLPSFCCSSTPTAHPTHHPQQLLRYLTNCSQ